MGTKSQEKAAVLLGFWRAAFLSWGKENYHTTKCNSHSRKYPHLIFIWDESRQKQAPETPLWLKMDVASTPKYRRNAIFKKPNKRTTRPETNHQTVKGDQENDENKQEYAKPGRGGSIHKDCSEYFSGIYRQIKSQEAGETDPLKYLVRLEREKWRVLLNNCLLNIFSFGRGRIPQCSISGIGAFPLGKVSTGEYSTASASKLNRLGVEMVQVPVAQSDRGERLECCPVALRHLTQGQCSFSYRCEGLQHYRKGANSPLLVLGGNKAASLGPQQPSAASS